VAEIEAKPSLYQKLRQRLKELQAQVKYHHALSDENFDKYLRAMAELDNYRKRVAKEYLEKENEANRNLLAKLLPVLDNLARAMESPTTGIEDCEAFLAFHQGIQLIAEQLNTLLEQEGLKVFNSKGEEFDPLRHDAMLAIESEKHEPNTVLDEVERGYAFRGKVLRHARVTVSTRKGGQEPAQPDTANGATGQTGGA
jgi:molecular chaperone GrpE